MCRSSLTSCSEEAPEAKTEKEETELGLQLGIEDSKHLRMFPVHSFRSKKGLGVFTEQNREEGGRGERKMEAFRTEEEVRLPCQARASCKGLAHCVLPA